MTASKNGHTQVELLRQRHLMSRIPVDQWPQRPKFLSRFTDEWNDIAGRHDTSDDLHHFIITQRKQKKWFRFGDEYDRLKSPGEESLSEVEWDALRAAYAEMNVGRDQYAGDPDLRDQLADKFHMRTGRYISGERLYAISMAQQKHRDNLWPHVSKDLGFTDISEVG
jgi:hypothetical protein